MPFCGLYDAQPDWIIEDTELGQIDGSQFFNTIKLVTNEKKQESLST